ncbi:hypothetical protein HOD20_07080 [archaeon]|jgi:pheromone shutdown-related protein TraB|nr:hypothetical protein [archaeon]MBT4352268.1 hypothetical protein [archaeon]MBT4648485.1 hypothetical protein [archaeon]MBT6821706.1 hypothetical protein [archaeon]
MIIRHNNIILIGTSHVAKESIKEIKEVIEAEEPKIIAIELDKKRAMGLLTKNKNTNKMYILKKIGITGLIFYMIGEFAQKKIGKFLDIEPGSDMLTALNIAREKKLMFALIDRDIEITLKKIGKNITWTDRKNFFIDILGGPFAKKQKINFDLSKVPPQEMINVVVNLMKKRYPGMYKTLIHERNVIMTKRILNLSTKFESKIVAVVGAGHIEGMHEILKKRLI